MENKEDIVLIRGQFQPEDAKELLLSLINYKLSFHNLKHLSTEIKTGQSNASSEERIVELSQSLKDIQNLIDKANNEGFELEIDSCIKINLRKA